VRIANFHRIMLAMLGAAGVAHAQTYDLVINNGRVMDPETMLDSVANVGISDGRIQVITQERITGRETINARGLVVAPGFIDTHFHSVDVFATKMSLRDGVTTGMDLEQGSARVGPRGEQGLPSTGMPNVIINGTIVVKDNEVLPVRPGQPIRFPVEAEGRFVAANITEWLDEYTIPVETVHIDDTGAALVAGDQN